MSKSTTRIRRPSHISHREIVQWYLQRRIVKQADGCWEMPDTTINENGYSRLVIDGSSVSGHRFFYSVLVGSIPEGMQVCHHCDNRRCVNPAHLFLGTNTDNMIDMVKKGRHARKGRGPRGERAPGAKLTEEQVLYIRRAYGNGGITQRSLAEQFGVNAVTIHSVVTRRTWTHI